VPGRMTSGMTKDLVRTVYTGPALVGGALRTP
jgi:hypothetical protein